MTTETTARHPKGAPVGGQFAATTHAEPDLALTPPASRLKLVADFGEDLSPGHQAAIEHWHGRLQDAGVTGELTLLSVDGADSDAGGPTLAGEWKSPRGNVFNFAVDHKMIEISCRHEWALDENHLEGSTGTLLKAPPFVVTDEDLTEVFEHARTQARTAAGWAARSTVRSNDKYRFAIPERISEGSGHEAGQVEVTATNGDEYVVRMDRGTFDARVYGPGGGQISDRMAAAFLTDVSESCGGNTDPEDLKYALLYSIEARVGEKW